MSLWDKRSVKLRYDARSHVTIATAFDTLLEELFLYVASEKHTVRRIDVGCGRSVSTRRMPARYSRKAIPVAMSPAPRITTNMAFSSVYLRCILQTITITTDDYSVSVE